MRGSGGRSWPDLELTSSALETQAWWGRLFQDPDFWQKWIDRFRNSSGPFSTNQLFATIDALANEVKPAHRANSPSGAWARGPAPFSSQATSPFTSGLYSYNFPGTYQGEIIS